TGSTAEVHPADAREENSTGRPLEIPAAEQVKVQVRHGLAGTFLAVQNETVAIIQAELLGQLGRDNVQVAEQLGVGLGDLVVRGDDLARDDEHVGRRLCIDVAEGEAAVVLVNDLGRDLLVDDLLEKVILHHGEVLPY